MMHLPVCNSCGVDLNDGNWIPSCKNKHYYICRKCHNIRNNSWRISNPHKDKLIRERERLNKGHVPMHKKRDCASFLGIHVAEQVLSNVFSDVVKMPNGNPGYDIVCNCGKFVDIKSSCAYIQNSGGLSWIFSIKRNVVADYFLCIAFGDREHLNPLHLWLIPGNVLNCKVSVSISESTIYKWDEYRLGIDKVVLCCNKMKESQ